MTSLLARRSVYCSKQANGKQSIATVFDTESGNIWFERTEHTWEKRKRVQRVHSTSGITEMVEDLGILHLGVAGIAQPGVIVAQLDAVMGGAAGLPGGDGRANGGIGHRLAL